MGTDAVVLRRWRDTGTVIALFPEMPADYQGRYCDSYEHIGQHGAADYYGVIRATVPVGAKEYADLAEELRRIGYNLHPIKRAFWRHHDKRQQVARQFATSDTGQSVGESN
jgi:hypothetical protein